MFKKKFYLLLILVSLFLTSCSGREEPREIEPDIKTEAERETTEKEDTEEVLETEIVTEEIFDNETEGETEIILETEIIEVSENTETTDDVQDNTSQEASEEEILKADSNLTNKDGQYLSIFNESLTGNVDEDGFPSLTRIHLSDGILSIEGSLNYTNFSNPEEQVLMENSTYRFKVDENTVLRAVSGLAEPMIFTEEDFNQYAIEIANTGLALIIEVEDGLAKTVSISS